MLRELDLAYGWMPLMHDVRHYRAYAAVYYASAVPTPFVMQRLQDALEQDPAAPDLVRLLPKGTIQ